LSPSRLPNFRSPAPFRFADLFAEFGAVFLKKSCFDVPTCVPIFSVSYTKLADFLRQL